MIYETSEFVMNAVNYINKINLVINKVPSYLKYLNFQFLLISKHGFIYLFYIF